MCSSKMRQQDTPPRHLNEENVPETMVKPLLRLAKGAAGIEWYIKLFLGVHFAANWVPVH